MAPTLDQHDGPVKKTTAANSHTHPEQSDNNLTKTFGQPGPRYLSMLSRTMSQPGPKRRNSNPSPLRAPPSMPPTFQYQVYPAPNDSIAPDATPPAESDKLDDAFLQVPKPRRPRMLTRVSWAASEVWDNHIEELNFPRCMYHLVSTLWLCLMLYLTWWILPIRGHWTSTRQEDKVPHYGADLER